MGGAKFGEPWTTYLGTVGGVDIPFIQGSDARSEFDKIIAGTDTRGVDRLPIEDVKERMKRAALCVNALEGIPDPAAYVEALESLVSDLREVIRICDRDTDLFMRAKANLARVEKAQGGAQ